MAVVSVRDDAVVLAAPPPLGPADRGRRRGRPRRAALPARRARRSSRSSRAAARVDARRRVAGAPAPGAPRATRGRSRVVAAVEELERLGVPTEQQTILVAGGLGRRAGRRAWKALRRTGVRAALPRRGRGPRRRATRPRRGRLARGAAPFRVAPALIEADAGRLGHRRRDRAPRRARRALLGAAAPRRSRAATAPTRCSRPSRSPGWRARASRSSARSQPRTPLIGRSLVLDLPRLDGALRGYPYDPDARSSGSARSPLRRASRRAARAVRARMLSGASAAR